MRRLITVFLLAAMVLMLAMPAIALETVTLTTRTAVYVRALPTKDSPKLGMIRSGIKLTGELGKGKYAGWLRIEKNGFYGYVAVSQMRRNAGVDYTIKMTGSANIRFGPGNGYGKVGMAKKGSTYHVDFYYNGWCHISDGWVWCGYCKKL